MSVSDLIAIVIMGSVMALVGYVLTRLAHSDVRSSKDAECLNNEHKEHSAAEVVESISAATAKRASGADNKSVYAAQGSHTQKSRNSAAGNSSTSVALHTTTQTEPKQPPEAQLIEELNRRLPQTQCAQCGHPGCRPYAEAIIRDNAPINQCPPGGTALIEELAEFLGTDVLPLDSEKGETKPPQVAFIVEQDCIGCVLCIAACPVDAIVGAARYMHTVIADQCTGCELCLPPCPVDCIELHPVETPLHRWQWPKPS